jgi:hypothetical protein
LVVSYLIVVPVALLGIFVPGCFISSPVAFMMTLEMRLGAGQFYQMIWPVADPSMGLPPSTSLGGTAPPGVGPAISGSLAVIVMTLVYALPHLLIAMFCGWSAVRGLRITGSMPPQPRRFRQKRLLEEGEAIRAPTEEVTSPVGTVLDGWDPVYLNDDQPVRVLEPIPHRKRYPVSDTPLLWKEVYHLAGEWTYLRFWQIYVPALAILSILAFVVSTLGAIGEMDRLGHGRFLECVRQTINCVLTPGTRVFTILLAGTWCVAAGWRTASSITREREGRTLGALLTLPIERYAVLRAKWWGGILRLRWFGIFLLAVWTVAVLCGAIHALAALLLAVAVAAHLAFLASLGVILSLACRNTMWANFSMSLMLLVMFAGSWVAIAYYEVLFGGSSSFGMDWWDQFYEVGLNPVRTWWNLGLNWPELEEAWRSEGEWSGTLSATLAGVGVYAALAGLLWLEARRQFAKLDAA